MTASFLDGTAESADVPPFLSPLVTILVFLSVPRGCRLNERGAAVCLVYTSRLAHYLRGIVPPTRGGNRTNHILKN